MTKPRILTIEDSVVTQATLRKTFEGFGCEIHLVGSAEEGLEWLEKNGPVHVLVLDFMLPGMSGPELYLKLTESPSLSQIPIVPFTSTMARQSTDDLSAIQDYIVNRSELAESRQSNPLVSKGQDENVLEVPPSLILSVANAVRKRGAALPPQFIAAIRKAANEIVQ